MHLLSAVLLLIAGLLQPVIAAEAQMADAATATTDAADGKRAPNERSPALTGVRRPLYRLQKSDVLEHLHNAGAILIH
jgi:hypothetical protein